MIEVGHFGPVGPGGLHSLPGTRIPESTASVGQNSGRKFLSGDKSDNAFKLQSRHQQYGSINRPSSRELWYYHRGRSVLPVVDR